jgi:hypothetical protein
MVRGSIDTASAHYVGANCALVQVLEFANYLAQFEGRIWTGETVGRMKNLFMHVHFNTSSDSGKE